MTARNHNVGNQITNVYFHGDLESHNLSKLVHAGMLKHRDGYVLKPIEKPVYGEREIRFYQDLQCATDTVSVELKKFVPKYLGTTTLKINEKGKVCIKLLI